MYRIIWQLLISGILFGSGPCISSCGPLLLSYMAGAGKNARSSFVTYVIFSSARMFAYVSLSAAAFLAGTFALNQAVERWRGAVMLTGGVFIVCLGILVFSRRAHKGFLNACRCSLLEKGGKSACALGLIAGFTPCAPLLGVLSYIVFVSKSFGESLAFGAAFGIGTSLSPLILLAGVSGFFSRMSLQRREVSGRILKTACAATLIILGAQLIMRGVFE